jgi:gliding motility-associated lipoprotein GldH
MKKLLIISLLAIIVGSCSQNKVFDENITIPDGVWSENNTVKLVYKIDNPQVPYNLYFNVRNSEMYPFKNLWLFATTHLPDGQIRRDTFNCVLADDKGKWLGDGAGDIWDNQLLYRKNFNFTQKGTYTIEIQHGMRTNDGNLPFVMEIGLRIEKSEK